MCDVDLMMFGKIEIWVQPDVKPSHPPCLMFILRKMPPRTRSKTKNNAMPAGTKPMFARAFVRAKTVHVKPVGPRPAFMEPFVMSKEDRRKLFQMRVHQKKMMCVEAEKRTVHAILQQKKYGQWTIVRQRIFTRMKYYPTFTSYYHQKVIQMDHFWPRTSTNKGMNEFLEKMVAELDAWTFTPDVVAYGVEEA